MGSGNKEFEEDEKKTDRTYVIDASALYPLLLKLKSPAYVNLLRRIRVLDLTKYEIGNAARYDKNLQSVPKMMELWGEVLESIEEVRITSLAEVQKIAVKQGITFYDAAYVHASMSLGTKLITNDREILQKFPGQSINLLDYESINSI
jgi:predicted nucleic acid-binding protein